MVIKIDMENAFDRVKHSFLIEVLNFFGFNQSFISWIGACISTPWIAPLINGRPTPFFKVSIGLREGCLLSPMLYVLMVEFMNIILEHERRTSSILVLKIEKEVRRINHSQFSDDTLLLGGASQIMANRFKLVLDQYGEALRGIINKNKSQVYAWNIKASTLLRISSVLLFPFSVD